MVVRCMLTTTLQDAASKGARSAEASKCGHQISQVMVHRSAGQGEVLNKHAEKQCNSEP
jgi:hypothetical protein